MGKFIKILCISIVTVIIIMVLALVLFGRDSHSNLSGTIPEQLDQYLTGEAFQGTALIVKGGEVLFAKGYGQAAPDVPNTPGTLYQIASLSKSFTAVAVMQLAEKQLISVEDPISKYVPDVWSGNTITIGHLLSHSSGIPDYLQPRFQFDYGQVWTPNEIVDTVRHAELEFAPGESFSYSNTGYVLLGMIIEKVSGLTYADYIKKHIFEPSGMTNSMFAIPSGRTAAQGYVDGKSGPHMDNSAAYSAGNIISTAEDLALFDKALRDGLLLSKDTMKLMGTTHAAKFPYQYGYGWYTQNVMGRQAVGHSGGYPSGFRHYIARLQDEELTVIVLSNEMRTNSKTFNRNLTSIVLQEPIWIWQKLF
jgi:CubicO group peptidase (beta-lactamase class C family)